MSENCYTKFQLADGAILTLDNGFLPYYDIGELEKMIKELDEPQLDDGA